MQHDNLSTRLLEGPPGRQRTGCATWKLMICLITEVFRFVSGIIFKVGVDVFTRSWQNLIIARVSVCSNDVILQRFKLVMVRTLEMLTVSKRYVRMT